MRQVTFSDPGVSLSEPKSMKAEFYEASVKIVESAMDDYGLDLDLKKLQDCVDDAKKA